MKRTVFGWAVEMQRKVLEEAQKRGASGDTVQAAQQALSLLVAEDFRIGAGGTCVCGSTQAEHDLNGKRVDQFRDGHGMVWGEEELCAQFRAVH